MHLPLSREEFATLLRLAAIGEAVMNDWTDPRELSPLQQEANDLLFALCGRAEDAGHSDLARQEENGEWGPSERLIAETKDVLHRYDNDVFWDELVARLTHRDLVAEYGQQTLDSMSDAYFRHAENPLLDFYWKEVRIHGIDRLTLREDADAPKQRRRPPTDRRSSRPTSTAEGSDELSPGL